MLVLIVHFSKGAVFVKVHEGGGEKEVEFKGVHQQTFHSNEILGGIGIVGDLDEVFQLGGVDLFVLAGNEKGSDSDQLELGAVYGGFGEVSVGQVLTQVEGFFSKLEFGVDVDEPVEEDCSKSFADVRLVLHVQINVFFFRIDVLKNLIIVILDLLGVFSVF